MTQWPARSLSGHSIAMCLMIENLVSFALACVLLALALFLVLAAANIANDTGLIHLHSCEVRK